MTSWGLSGGGSRYHVEHNKHALCDSKIVLRDRDLTPSEETKCKKCMKALAELRSRE